VNVLQVHPAKLTHALIAAAQAAAGAQVVLGTVTGISTAAGAVTGVRVQQRGQETSAAAGGSTAGSSEVQLPADVVVLAMGPWSSAARAWLPAAPEISGEHQHSLFAAAMWCQTSRSRCMYTGCDTLSVTSAVA
jgi:glycerol-3-phosphate dehydrogenase